MEIIGGLLLLEENDLQEVVSSNSRWFFTFICFKIIWAEKTENKQKEARPGASGVQLKNNIFADDDKFQMLH